MPINGYYTPEKWAEETEPTNKEILESQAVEMEKKLISEVELHNKEHFLVPKDLIKFDKYSELHLDANAEACKITAAESGSGCDSISHKQLQQNGAYQEYLGGFGPVHAKIELYIHILCRPSPVSSAKIVDPS